MIIRIEQRLIRFQPILDKSIDESNGLCLQGAVDGWQTTQNGAGLQPDLSLTYAYT